MTNSASPIADFLRCAIYKLMRYRQENIQKRTHHEVDTKPTVIARSIALLIILSAFNNISARDKNTAIGATINTIAGSILTAGDAIGTVGGTVIGGVIGNPVETGR